MFKDYKGNLITDKNTKHLHLWGVTFATQSELQALAEYPFVTHVNLASSNINDEGLKIISGFSNIEILDLDATDITDAGLPHLAPLVRLNQLRLKEVSQLTDAALPHLVSLQALELLHLEGTSVTLAGLTVLTQLSNLKLLIIDPDLLEDQVDEAARRNQLESISHQLSNCEILLKGYGVVTNGRWA
jgi:hypothetical protein